uniref:Uncharacterized protein n=1 Tax=Cannabis sativa TaxID=3483 RepID=A0A803R361_CANSA
MSTGSHLLRKFSNLQVLYCYCCLLIYFIFKLFFNTSPENINDLINHVLEKKINQFIFKFNHFL